jgi:hypothetical protein
MVRTEHIERIGIDVQSAEIGNLMCAIEEIHDRSARNGGLDVLWYGSHFHVEDKSDLDRPPVHGGEWYNRLPLPWYMEAFDANYSSVDDVSSFERALETELLDAFNLDPTMNSADVDSVVTRSDIITARETVYEVFVEDSVRDYILDIVEATRDSADVAYGASPRAAITLLQASKGRAAIRGRKYVIPDDPKSLAVKLLAHRIVLSTEAELSDISPEKVINEVLDQVTIPVDAGEPGESGVAGDGGEVAAKDDEAASSEDTE